MSYNRHFFRNLNLGKESKPNPYKNDIIVDPRGQWNHPGQNTRIPGNEITMQGVPYPVWAQPNVGPGRMMQPGMNYTFPGAEYVDEIPMAQRGGVPIAQAGWNQQAYDDSLALHNASLEYQRILRDEVDPILASGTPNEVWDVTRRWNNMMGGRRNLLSAEDQKRHDAFHGPYQRLLQLNKIPPSPDPTKEFQAPTDPAYAAHQFRAPVGKPKGTTDPKMSVAINLRKRGMDSSFAARKELAKKAGIENYKGTADQNIALNKWVFSNYEGDQFIDREEKPLPITLPPRTFEDIAPIDTIPAVANIIPHVRPGWTPDTGEHKFVEPIPGEPRQHHFNSPSFETEYRPSTIRPVFQREGGQIKIKESNKGKFTKKANAAGMSVQEFASKVLAATEGRYSASTRKQANFARNASKWKKQEGGDIMKYQIEGEVAPHVESTEPTEEEIFQATLDWFNTHPFADMPSMSDLSEIHGAESQVPKWKEMRGDEPGERYQGVYVPFANVTARPTVEGEKQKRGQYYYDTVPMENGANRLNIVMVGDKPMVMPPTQGDMSNAEYRDITRMYGRFNKEYLHTYKKPARRKSGTSEVFHVYGAGLPYASDKSAWYEQYPSMNPDQQQDGGYIELELTDQEIEQYRKGGYIVEELPKAQEGKATSPEEWEQEIRAIEKQIGNPSGWAMNDYYLLQDKLNAYKDWRENTPEGQAVVDYHNEEGEYDVQLPEHLQAQKGIINLSGPRASKAEYLDIEDDVKEFADRYVTSEHHRNLLEKQGYPEDKIYWRMQDVLNYEPSLHTRFKTHGNSYVGAAGEGDIPLSLDSGQEAGMPVVSYNVLNPHPFPLDQVVSHEWGHIPVSTGFNPLTENERKEFINRLKPGVAKNEHDLEPQENRSDQFELRYFLDREGIYDSSKGEKFTQKHLDEYRKKTGAPNRMFKLYEDKDIIWLMNNIAATDTEPQGLVKAQRGGEYNFGPTDPAERKKLYNYRADQEAPDMILTLKDDKEFIDGIANWGMVSGLDTINPEFNDQIKNRLYSGKWGYNPKTGYLVNLAKAKAQDKVTSLPESEKKYLKDRETFWKDEIADFEKDRVPVQIANEDAWSPHFGFETMQGMQDADDYRGRTVYMTQEEADEYTKARTQHNWGAIYQHPLWYLPGMIFGATVAPMYGAIAAAPGLYESGKNIYEGDAGVLDYANVLTAGVAARNIPHMPKLPANIKNITTPSRQKITNFLVEKNIVSADPDLITAGFNPLKKVFGTDIKLKNIADKGKAAGLTPQQIAQRQMNEVGITTAQREAYTPLVSDLLYYGINPRGTGFGVPGKVAAMPFNWASAGLKKFTGKPAYSPAGLGARDDAWSLFLGKPQQAGTFSMAETVPTPGIYKPGSLQGMEKFSINALQQNPNALATDLLWNWAKNRGDKGIYPHQGTPFFAGETSIYPTDQFADVMGGYNLRRTGPNTLEYNDIWDLAVPGVPESIANRFLGKKFLSTGQAQFDDLGQTLHTIAAKEGYKGTENLGDFIPKTTGTGVTTPTSLGQTGPISQSSFFKPTWAKKVKEKLSKIELSTPVPEGTPYHEIGSKNLIEESIKGMPVETRDFPFAGTNVYSPLTPSGMPAGAAQYKWPAGISQGQLNNFVSKIYSNEVPVKTIEAVFDSLTKLNPEIKELVGSGVPKSEIIAYMSGGMPIDEIESTHKFMSNSNPDPSSLSNVYKTTRKIKEAPDKFINLLKRKFPAEKNLMNAQQERFDKAIKFTKDWYLDPEEVSKLQSGIPAWNARVHDYLTEGTELGEFRSPNDLASEYPTAKILRPDIAEKIDFINSFKSKDLLENQYISPSYTPGEELMRSTDKLVSRFQIKDKTTPFGKMLKESLPNQRGINLNSPFGNTGITYADSPTGKLYNPDAVAATGSHELAHSAQKIQEWSKVITKYDPEFGYYVPNTDTELGKRFAEAMVEPAPLSELEKLAGQPYSHKTWLSSPDELHSDLNPLREATYQNFMQRGDHTAEEIMNFLKNPPDELIDTWLKEGGLNNHFKPTTSMAEKRALIKLLPAFIPVALGVGAAAQEQDGGFIELELTDEEIEQYKKGGYIVTEV